MNKCDNLFSGLVSGECYCEDIFVLLSLVYVSFSHLHIVFDMFGSAIATSRDPEFQIAVLRKSQQSCEPSSAAGGVFSLTFSAAYVRKPGRNPTIL